MENKSKKLFKPIDRNHNWFEPLIYDIECYTLPHFCHMARDCKSKKEFTPQKKIEKWISTNPKLQENVWKDKQAKPNKEEYNLSLQSQFRGIQCYIDIR